MGSRRHMPELAQAIEIGQASLWVQLIYVDEACKLSSRSCCLAFPSFNTLTDFHVAIAVSIAALNKRSIYQENTVEGFRHVAYSLRMLNERLSGTKAVSDETIAVVVLMTVYEGFQGQQCRGLTHLSGLQRMIDLRGGISELVRNAPSLTPKIFR
jgi:hypothetical protein